MLFLAPSLVGNDEHCLGDVAAGITPHDDRKAGTNSVFRSRLESPRLALTREAQSRPAAVTLDRDGIRCDANYAARDYGPALGAAFRETAEARLAEAGYRARCFVRVCIEVEGARCV